MHANNKITPFLVSSLLMLLFSGCQNLVRPVEVVATPDFTEEHQSVSVSRRFEQSVSRGPTAVESAIELSEKHAKLVEQAAALQQKNYELTNENHSLKAQFVASQTKLKQAEKELVDANEQLRELLIELNNWKVKITGFQEEMRQADTTQLQALLKILEILGGQVKTEPTQAEYTDSDTTFTTGPTAKHLSQETTDLGEANE